MRLCVCTCVISQFSGNIALRCLTYYDVARLILMSPIDCWQISTPFLCKASFCTTKIGDFRTQGSGDSRTISKLLQGYGCKVLNAMNTLREWDTSTDGSTNIYVTKELRTLPHTTLSCNFFTQSGEKIMEFSSCLLSNFDLVFSK